MNGEENKQDSGAATQNALPVQPIKGHETPKNKKPLRKYILPAAAGALTLTCLFLLATHNRQYGETGTDIAPTPSPEATVPLDKKAVQGTRNGDTAEGNVAPGKTGTPGINNSGVAAGVVTSGGAVAPATSAGATAQGAVTPGQYTGTAAAGRKKSEDDFLFCTMSYKETNELMTTSYRTEIAAGTKARMIVGPTCKEITADAGQAKMNFLAKNGVRIVKEETDSPYLQSSTDYSVGPFPDMTLLDKKTGETLRLYFNSSNNKIQDERYDANGNMRYLAYFNPQDANDPVKGPNGEPHERRFNPDGTEKAPGSFAAMTTKPRLEKPGLE